MWLNKTIQFPLWQKKKYNKIPNKSQKKKSLWQKNNKIPSTVKRKKNSYYDSKNKKNSQCDLNKKLSYPNRDESHWSISRWLFNGSQCSIYTTSTPTINISIRISIGNLDLDLFKKLTWKVER